MAKKKKIHTFAVADIIRSVLRAQEVTALCGYTKTHTREEVDEVPGLISSGASKPCSGCARAMNGLEEDATIRRARGWQEMLEHQWLHDNGRRVSATQMFTYRYDAAWPRGA